ncbi:hypothetical protein CPB85DRAFT_932941 [Mucidula mucida]|nr:hypothetical protein CPB85DRAFT_932941 [Mucidula mucida]
MNVPSMPTVTVQRNSITPENHHPLNSLHNKGCAWGNSSSYSPKSPVPQVSSPTSSSSRSGSSTAHTPRPPRHPPPRPCRSPHPSSSATLQAHRSLHFTPRHTPTGFFTRARGTDSCLHIFLAMSSSVMYSGEEGKNEVDWSLVVRYRAGREKSFLECMRSRRSCTPRVAGTWLG